LVVSSLHSSPTRRSSDLIKLRNDGPVHFDVSRQLLRIQEFRFTGEGTDLLASGTVQLTGERQLDLRAQGRVNLKLVESFNADFRDRKSTRLNSSHQIISY